MKFIPTFHVFAFSTIACWSVAYPVTTIVMRDFSSQGLAFVRYTIAGLLMLAVVQMKKLKLPARRDWGWFFACGLAGFVLYPIFFNYGCAVTPSSVSSTIVSVTPLIAASGARVCFGERLDWRQWAAIGLAFCGVPILLLKPGEDIFSGGTLWLLAAALCLACYSLMQRRLIKSYQSIDVSAFGILAGAVMLLPYAPQGMAELGRASAAGVTGAILMGVFSSAVAYVCWAKAFSIAPNTSSVTNYMFFTPFLSTILGFFLSHELPTLQTITGGTIILSGMLLYQRAQKRSRAAAE